MIWQLADLADLVFSPPPTGVDSIYNIDVTVTVQELGAEKWYRCTNFVRGPIILVIDLNDDDDSVTASSDSYNTAAGIQVVMDVLDNDSIPDGGGAVTEVNGNAIAVGSPDHSSRWRG